MAEVTTAPETPKVLDIQGNRAQTEARYKATKQFEERQKERAQKRLGRLRAIPPAIFEPLARGVRVRRLQKSMKDAGGVGSSAIVRGAAADVTNGATAQPVEVSEREKRGATEYRAGEQVIERVVGGESIGQELATRLGSSDRVRKALENLRNVRDGDMKAKNRAERKLHRAVRAELKAIAKDSKYENDPTVREFFGEDATRAERYETVLAISQIAQEYFAQEGDFQENLKNLDVILQKEFARSGRLERAYKNGYALWAIQNARTILAVGGLALFAVNPLTGAPLLVTAVGVGATTYFVQRHKMRFERIIRQTDKVRTERSGEQAQQESEHNRKLLGRIFAKAWGEVDFDASDDEFERQVRRASWHRAGITFAVSLLAGGGARFGAETLLEHQSIAEAGTHFFDRAIGLPQGGTPHDSLTALARHSGGFKADFAQGTSQVPDGGIPWWQQIEQGIQEGWANIVHTFTPEQHAGLSPFDGQPLTHDQLVQHNLQGVTLHDNQFFGLDAHTGHIDIVDAGHHILAKDISINASNSHLIGTFADGSNSTLDVAPSSLEGKDIFSFEQGTHVDFLPDTPQHNWQELHSSVQNDGGSNYILLDYVPKDPTGHENFITVITPDGRHVFLQNNVILAVSGPHAGDQIAILDGNGNTIDHISSADLAHQLGIGNQTTIDNFAKLIHSAQGPNGTDGLWHGTQNASDLQVIMANRGLMNVNGGQALYSMRIGGGYFDQNGFHIGASNHYFDNSLIQKPLPSQGTYDVYIKVLGNSEEDGSVPGEIAEHVVDFIVRNPGYIAAAVVYFLVGRSHWSNGPTSHIFIKKGPHPVLSDLVGMGTPGLIFAVNLVNPGFAITFGTVAVSSWLVGRFVHRKQSPQKSENPPPSNPASVTPVAPPSQPPAAQPAIKTSNGKRFRNPLRKKPYAPPSGPSNPPPQGSFNLANSAAVPALLQIGGQKKKPGAKGLHQLAQQIDPSFSPAEEKQLGQTLNAVRPIAKEARGGNPLAAEVAAKRIVQNNVDGLDLTNRRNAEIAAQAIGVQENMRGHMADAIQRAAILESVAREANIQDPQQSIIAAEKALRLIRSKVDSQLPPELAAAEEAKAIQQAAEELKIRVSDKQFAQKVAALFTDPKEKAIAYVIFDESGRPLYLQEGAQKETVLKERVSGALQAAASGQTGLSQQQITDIIKALSIQFDQKGVPGYLGETTAVMRQALYDGLRSVVPAQAAADAIWEVLPDVAKPEMAADLISHRQNQAVNRKDIYAFGNKIGKLQEQGAMDRFEQILARKGVLLTSEDIAVLGATAEPGDAKAKLAAGLKTLVKLRKLGSPIDGKIIGNTVLEIYKQVATTQAATLPTQSELQQDIQQSGILEGVTAIERASIFSTIIQGGVDPNNPTVSDDLLQFARAATGISQKENNTQLSQEDAVMIALIGAVFVHQKIPGITNAQDHLAQAFNLGIQGREEIANAFIEELLKQRSLPESVAGGLSLVLSPALPDEDIAKIGNAIKQGHSLSDDERARVIENEMVKEALNNEPEKLQTLEDSLK